MNNLATVKTTNLTVVRNAPLTEMTDAELVVLCQNNNERAFDILFKRHQRLVSGMLGKLAPDWNDSADLSQEVFIRMWRGISKLENPKAFKSWMCQIVTHLFYDELRKSPRRSPAISLDHSIFADDENDGVTRDIADYSAGPEELMQRKDTHRMVETAIDSLPEAFRTAIILRDLEDMTYEEISVVTKTDIGTVKSRISRARTKVQRVLQPQFGADRKLSA
jgi:RNA polymerase sigma-70 factor (ECF subfamily)